MPGPGDKPRDPNSGYNKKPTKQGTITESRRAWTKFSGCEAVFYVRDDDDEAYGIKETGELITLALTQGKGRKSFSLNLGPYTEDELLCLFQVIQMAFAAALDIAKRRDLVAAQAAVDGDFSYARSLRPDPSIYVREGEKFSHIPYFKRHVETSKDVKQFEFDFNKVRVRAMGTVSAPFVGEQAIVLDEDDMYDPPPVDEDGE